MVKVGFIVEGHCEKMVLSGESFQQLLVDLNIILADEIGNARGKYNLLHESTTIQAQIMRDQGATHIFILRDLDDLPDLEAAKKEVTQANDITLCVAVRELEAWFLANSETLSTVFKTDFYFEYPEREVKPFDTLNALSRQFRQGRGINDKRSFTNLMLANGFSIERAAEHPNCPSARYFLNTLQTLALVG